jgi:hypothetical protein
LLLVVWRVQVLMQQQLNHVLEARAAEGFFVHDIQAGVAHRLVVVLLVHACIALFACCSNLAFVCHTAAA